MPRRQRGQQVRRWIAVADVALEDEERLVSRGVALLVPALGVGEEVAGELGVGGEHEASPVLGVLADEDDVRAAEVGRAPPDDEQRPVAQELVEVLVDAAGPVVLDKEVYVAV